MGQGGGILGQHDIVVLVDQIRRHRHGEEVALLQHLLDGPVEVLSGCQELVVPDGDVPADGVLVDEAHQLLGLFPVLLAIAEEDVGVKGRPDPGREPIVRQDGADIGRQDLVKAALRLVGAAGIQILKIPEPAGEESVQPRLHHEGQDGNVPGHGQGKLHVHGPVRGGEEPGGNGHHEKLHPAQTQFQIFRVVFPARVGLIPDGAVLDLQYPGGALVKIFLPVIRVTGKIDAGLSLGVLATDGLIEKRGHSHLLQAE